MNRTWNSDQKKQVAARNGWRCASCNELLNAAFEIDHIVALENGGCDEIERNAQALCSNCHALKSQSERLLRIEKARLKLTELQKHQQTPPPPPKHRHRAVAVRPEDVILDTDNPFASFAYMW